MLHARSEISNFNFFTIPVRFFLGGLLVDNVFEPFMENQSGESIFVRIFGSEKGSGAAFLFFVIGIAGVLVCLIFRRNKHILGLETKE